MDLHCLLISVTLGVCSLHRSLPCEGKEVGIIDQSHNNGNNLCNFNFARCPYGKYCNCASQALAPNINSPCPDNVDCEHPLFIIPIDSSSILPAALPPGGHDCSKCPLDDCSLCFSSFGLGELVGHEPKVIKVCPSCPSGDCDNLCYVIIGKESTVNAVAMAPKSV